MRQLLFILVCVLSISANAEIYKTIDEKGNVIYTDMKPRDSKSEEVKLKPITPIEKIPAINSAPAASNSPDTENTTPILK